MCWITEETRGRPRGEAGIAGGTCADSFPSTDRMKTTMSSGRRSFTDPAIGFGDEEEEKEEDAEGAMDDGCRDHSSTGDKSMRAFTGHRPQMIGV